MKLKRKEADLLRKAIHKWTEDALISTEQAEALNKSFERVKFDWQSLSFYAFVFAIVSIIISGIALLADKWLMEMFEKIVDASEGYKATFFSVASVLLFYYGQKIRKNRPDKIYSHTAVNLLAIITTAVALGYFSIIFDNGSGHFSIFIFIAALLYGTLALSFRSSFLWTTALLGLFIWFGTETAFLADWGSYFWGMNLVVRYIPFSLLLLAGFVALYRFNIFSTFYQNSFTFCLLALYFSLWAASVFGNYGNFSDWSGVSQLAILPWGSVLLLTTVFGIVIGIRYRNNLIRETSILFLMFNFYSRYFEFGWELLHPTVFFALLALSFWLIGKKAERIWTLSDYKKSK